MCNGSVNATGRPRVVDRRGKGIVAIGIESFADVATRHVYVDKTMVIPDLIDRGGVTLFCRPRRFGKSLMLRTLQCYFEAPVEGYIDDAGPLFEGLAVMGADDYYTAERGAHPVIYLGLNACGGDTWEAMRASVARVVADEYGRHGYLAESGSLSPADKERFERVWNERGSVEDLEGSLARLAQMLRRHHRSQVVILIDEYDKIVTEGHLHGYRDEATGFLKRWLTGALKGTVDLRLAALTGVQRVSKESIFSDLNNFVVDTALDHRYAEAFGFTQPEVEELAAHLGRADKAGELAEWYDGYDFGGESVYNPWSVLNYFFQGCIAQPYWTNTSSNTVVKDMIARADEGVNAQLTALAEGGAVEAMLDLSVVFGEIDSDTSAIWSQLYLAGYVTTHDVAEPNDSALVRRLEVPNLEVARLFSRELVERAEAAAGGRHALSALHAALASGDGGALAYELERALLNSVSYFDLRDENSAHMWLLSLLYGMEGYRFPRSNREVGRGRPDVVCEPDAAHETALPAIACEVKFARAAAPEELQALAQSALDEQALPRRYAHGLAGAGALLWGVAFDAAKHTAVACSHV
ncbi:MAG TPA: hypothetical protein DCP91_13000 [Eggerthellaceae bacterium]|nr:hypothetical protein [Eggerthellaceae bacterium]